MVYNLRERKRRKSNGPPFLEEIEEAESSHCWKKVLYEKQPFPDNYTDETQFLSQLRTNVGLVQYRARDALCAACTVMAHADLIALFFCCFELIQAGRLDTVGLCALCSVAFGALLCLSLLLQCAKGGDDDDNSSHPPLSPSSSSFLRPLDWPEHCRTLVTVLAFGYLFTPIIRTLTTSISTDTIYASAIFLFLVSLIVHDYGMDGPIVSLPLSVNLCLSASVFLISRLQSDFLTFLLLALSLCLFCFWPQQRNALFARHQLLSPLLLLPLFAASMFGLARLVGGALAIMHFLLHLFIILFCPLLFIRMQRLKSTIHGPWDEATLRASIEEG